MLAFILLVVLGGGIGLVAVSLAGSPKPATDGGPDHRAPGHDDDPEPDPVEPVADTEPEPDVERGSPRRRPDPRTVPRAYTAIEGRFDEVATPPWWRRLLSLVALVIIAVLIGVGLAAVAAGVIGAIAELLDTAVG